MEYPFSKCPKKTTEPTETNPIPRFDPDNPAPKEGYAGYAPEIVAKLISQAIILEEESMKLLDLLVELIEQKPPLTVDSSHNPFPVNFEAKNRIYLD